LSRLSTKVNIDDACDLKETKKSTRWSRSL